MGIITFIEGKVPLRKTITKEKTIPYPNVKNLKSHTVEYLQTVEGLKEKYAALIDAANKNYAQYRGTFVEPLNWESRKGKTDKDTPNSTIVFDLDSMLIPGVTIAARNNEAQDIKYAAEAFIKMLPEPFHNVSYFAHASSSWGTKGNAICMHVEFELATPISPKVLKNWLYYLNLSNENFKKECVLTNSKTALSYPIDPTLAENSRLIYISPPKFEGRDDPFKSREDRLVLVLKQDVAVATSQIVRPLSPDSIEKLKKTRVNELRRAEGLNNFTPKLITLTSMGEQIRVISNPDNMHMTMVSVDEQAGYVRWNVNGGDSGAYYTRLHSPNIVYNFKGEDPFEFSKADPEAYSKFLDAYGALIGEANPILPLIFTDYDSANQYKCIYNLKTEDFTRSPAPIKGETQIREFYAEYGKVRPDIIPTWEYSFNPHSPRVLDFANKRANKYSMPVYLKNPAPIVPWAKGVSYGQAAAGMQAIAPWCYQLIYHMLGADDATFEHFVNWLAFCLQEKKLSATCWVITGTQGTGKGQFYDRILLPLFGERHTAKFFIEAIEDQFNATSETRLMTVIDEFNIRNARNPDQMESKLKNLVTEERTRIRGMRTEGRENVISYNNWIIYSNDIDAHRIPPEDRRYNVSPPQYVKIEEALPEMHNRTKELMDPEVGRLATFLLEFDCDHNKASTVLKNEARDNMMEAAKTWIERFFTAFYHGQLEYLAESLEHNFNPNNKDIPLRIQARDIVTSWIKDANAKRGSFITSQQLNIIYNIRADRPISTDKFNSLCAKYHLPEKVRRRIGRQRPRGWLVKWNIGDEELAHWTSVADLENTPPASNIVTIQPTQP